LRENSKPRSAFERSNIGQAWNEEAEKSTYVIELNVRKPLVYFTKNQRAETLKPGLELDNPKSQLKSGVCKCISRLNGPIFEDDHEGFLKKGESRPF
jgi:hypothetical protein